jgi:hypothetical protein
MEDAQRATTNIDRLPAGLNSNLVQEPLSRQLVAFRLRHEALLLDVRVTKNIRLRICRHQCLACV